jgi:hypothetical protein
LRFGPGRGEGLRPLATVGAPPKGNERRCSRLGKPSTSKTSATPAPHSTPSLSPLGSLNDGVAV